MITPNQTLIADNAVTLLKFAKQQIPTPEAQKELVDYILSKIGEVSDDTPVTIVEVTNSGFDLVAGIATEANAPKLVTLTNDVRKTITDGEEGHWFAEIADIANDYRDVKNLLKK